MFAIVPAEVTSTSTTTYRYHSHIHDIIEIDLAQSLPLTPPLSALSQKSKCLKGTNYQTSYPHSSNSYQHFLHTLPSTCLSIATSQHAYITRSIGRWVSYNHSLHNEMH